MEQLALLATVKQWTGQADSTEFDALLTRLNQQASRFILNTLNRPTFFKNEVQEIRDGVGGTTMTLGQFPVTDLTGVTVSGTTITEASSPVTTSSGYRLEQWDGLPPGNAQLVYLRGYAFTIGQQNVVFDYTTGFYIEDEAGTVPAATSYTITVQQPYGEWGRDDGVTLANGTALTKVTGAPAAMQYSVSQGVYTFNVAQASAAVLISYSYVPPDITQACCELVAERFSYMNRIGQMSHSQSGQVTTQFSLEAMPDYVREILDKYMKVTYL